MPLDDIKQARLEKLDAIKQAGNNPFPAISARTHTAAEALASFDELSVSKGEVVLAGRVMAVRGHGAITFMDLQDGTGTMQVLFKNEKPSDFVDIGDFIEAAGTLFTTKKNEKTLEAATWKILAKSLLPLPEKWHGLVDVEERYRKRYLDLLMNPEVREKFVKRAQIIQGIRDYLLKNSFLEVQTPSLQPLYGGASARPFKTHLHALDQDMYLRIAPELYLKRLIVGGFERVFEFTTNFRNEGIDREHNPEFSAVEWYTSYKDYTWSMDFVEDLFATLDPELFKKPFKRITYAELMKDTGSMTDEVFKEKIRPTLQEPTIVYEYPKAMFPLAKLKEGSLDTVEVFQVYAKGFELVKAFTELNDPRDQKERLMAQESNRAKGDEEAQRMDDDYIEAMEYGMPPNAGVGIGIDRLVTLITGSHSIREVILFPFMKNKDGDQ